MNKNYINELYEIKKEMDAKEIERTDSLILNTEHEQQIKKLKQKLKESEVQNYNLNECEDFKKLIKEGKNIETIHREKFRDKGLY